MLRYQFVRHAAALVLMGMLSACASNTSLNTAWLNESYNGPPFTKIIVLGMGMDSATRRVFEDSFAAALRKSGVQAVPGYTVLPGDTRPTPEQLHQVVQQVGADGALVTRLVGVEQKTRTSPGYIRTTPGFGYRGGFYGYYNGYYSRIAIVEPPRTTTYNVAEMQTELWSLQGEGGLVWSGNSQTISPSDAAKVGSNLANVVAEDLASARLIPSIPGGS